MVDIKKYFEKNTDKKILFIFLIIVLLAKLPTASLDYHWDELVYVGQAKFYSIYGFMSIPPEDVGHVRLFSWILAASFKIFGETPFLSHFIVAIFSLIGIYFTYLLGKFLFNEKVGLMASLLLFFFPIYFSMSGQALFDIPLTALSMMTLYFGLKQKIPHFLIAGSALVLIKEPGILTILVLVIYQLMKKKYKTAFIYGLPLIALLVWNSWYWTQTGYFGFHHGSTFVFSGIAMLFKKFVSNLYQIFFWNYNWILTLIIILVIYKKSLYKNKISVNYIPLFLLILFYVALFSYSLVLPRYLLPVLPIFFIFSSYAINQCFGKKSWIVLLIVLILFVSTYGWNFGVKALIQDPVFHSTVFVKKPLASILNGELSIDYFDVINTEKEALNYIFSNYPNSIITSSIPLVNNISTKIDIGHREWHKYNITVLYPPSKENIQKSKLVVYEPYAPWSEENMQLLSQLVLIKKFEENGKFVAIYKHQ